MSHSVVIAAGDQVVAYEIRSLVSEVENFRVVDVADTSTQLEDAVLKRDPEVVLVHANIGPVPVLQVVRELMMRRPGAAVVLLADHVTPEVFTEAMDAGARGVMPYPVSLEDLQARLTSAAQWSAQMRHHLSYSGPEPGGASGRGRMIVLAGAKGGVGTSTVATHLAHDFVRSTVGKSVCLVDLDLEKGDLGNLLGVSHRLDISDLAKVADDLGPQTVSSALHRDASGLAVLLAPSRIEDVGVVQDREARLILGAVRRHFDLVVVDAGAHVTPVSAAAVEIADEVVLVTNPEVLALRGVHRTMDTWSRVDVRKPQDVKVLLNRVSKTTDIQPDAAARLLPVRPLGATLPAAFKRLEPGLNYRSPDEVKDKTWWAAVHRLLGELGIGQLGGHSTATPRGGERRRGRRQARAGEQGQASLEFTGMFPLILLLSVLVWQVGLMGAALAMSGHAADEAARAASIGHSDVEGAAREAVPSWLSSAIQVESGGGSVRVVTQLPVLAPGVSTERWTYSTSVPYVDEGAVG
jgi:pilus assembly protein CpaE